MLTLSLNILRTRALYVPLAVGVSLVSKVVSFIYPFPLTLNSVELILMTQS